MTNKPNEERAWGPHAFELFLIAVLVGVVALAAGNFVSIGTSGVTKNPSSHAWNLGRGDIFHAKDGVTEYAGLVVNVNEDILVYRRWDLIVPANIRPRSIENDIIRVIHYNDPSWKFAVAQYLGIEPMPSPAPAPSPR